MKILMLSSRIPYPLTAGFRIRIFNEAKYFKANGHSVSLLYLGNKNEYEENKLALQDVFESITCIPLNKFEIFLRLFIALFSLEPFQVALYKNKTFSKKISLIENEYDLIIANHIRTVEYLKGIDKKKVIIDLHDAISYNYYNRLSLEKGLKRLLYKSEFKRVLNYEKKTVSSFNKNILVSEKDRVWLKNNGADVSNVFVIPVAVRDDITIRKNDYSTDENAICFLGKMSYQPNSDAVIWFSHTIFPKLLEKYPDIKFYILGIEPPESVINLTNEYKNIIVTGFVDNPFEIIARSKVSVVPIRNGAGVQNKVLESMIVGTPVVASTIAAEGVGAIHDNQILVAHNDEEYFQYLTKLIDSTEYRYQIGHAGQIFIEENYTWNSLWKKWEDLISMEV